MNSRANFSAPSMASAPLLARNTCGKYLGSTPASALRELGALVVIEIAGTQRQRFSLLLDRRRDARVAVPEHRDALCGSKIEILVAALVVEPAALAPDDDDVAAARGRAAENEFFSFGVA